MLESTQQALTELDVSTSFCLSFYTMHPPSTPDLEVALANHFSMMRIVGNTSQAFSLAKRLLALYSSQQYRESDKYQEVATWSHNLAGVLVTQEHYAAAEPLYLQALEFYKEANGPTSMLASNSQSKLAVCAV